jgi:hypothetical protein
MGTQNGGKLNRLERELPEGLLVDAAWLGAHGYSTALRHQYIASGKLEQPARSVYRRPRGSLSWQQAVISLQTLLGRSLAVGGLTALELQGFAHYLARQTTDIHLYGPEPPPNWLANLAMGVCFHYHNSHRLFPDSPAPPSFASLPAIEGDGGSLLSTDAQAHFLVMPWGHWNWPLVLSTPERALLELLDELPDRESFHQIDMVVQGLTNLRPRRLQELLGACNSVKVKRLFFFFADRHQHAWRKRLDQEAVYLGQGKRVVAKGGMLDPRYQITVPRDLNGVQ